MRRHKASDSSMKASTICGKAALLCDAYEDSYVDRERPDLSRPLRITQSAEPWACCIPEDVAYPSWNAALVCQVFITEPSPSANVPRLIAVLAGNPTIPPARALG